MSAADQRAVVAVLRTPLPLSSDRWMPAQVARMAGLSAKAGGDAIRALRNAGKIKFGALELSPSMLIDEQRSPAKAGGEVVTEEAVAVEPVSRAAGRPASRRKVAEGRGRPPQRESGLIAGQAIAHDTGGTVGGPVKPPSPIQETATEPCAHPGDQQAEALSAGERRHVARKFGGGVGNPLSTNVVAVQAVLLAEPEDAFLFLRRKWPKLLREVIAQARASGTTPAAQLAHVIESGLIAAAGSL